MKKVSIIIPTYNSTTVAKSLSSIQKSDEMEIIVVDGGSEKKYIELLEPFKKNIDIFVSEKDYGLYDAMNKGIKRASGEWIFTLASDDQLLCNPIEIINKYDRTGIDLICGCLVAIDFSKRYFIINPDNDFRKLELECTLCHPGTFFRKNVYERFGMYNCSYKCAADHELFLRVVKQGGKVEIVPDLISFFSYGGISTVSPWQAFIEDINISDEYGVSKLKSRYNLLKRVIRFYGSKIKDSMKLSHKTQYMTEEELRSFLKNHSEVKFDILV